MALRFSGLSVRAGNWRTSPLSSLHPPTPPLTPRQRWNSARIAISASLRIWNRSWRLVPFLSHFCRRAPAVPVLPVLRLRSYSYIDLKWCRNCTLYGREFWTGVNPAEKSLHDPRCHRVFFRCRPLCWVCSVPSMARRHRAMPLLFQYKSAIPLHTRIVGMCNPSSAFAIQRAVVNAF
jgi:hypothetical protein